MDDKYVFRTFYIMYQSHSICREHQKTTLLETFLAVSFKPQQIYNNKNKYLTIYQVSQVDNMHTHRDDQDSPNLGEYHIHKKR